MLLLSQDRRRMAEDPRDDRARVPGWDGDPRFWRRYKDEVRIWLLAEKKDVDYSLAAHLIQRLSGAARRAALSLDDKLLAPVRARAAVVDEQGVVRQVEVEEDLTAGVKNVLNHLESCLTPEKSVRRGATMSDFFGSRKYYRRAGERVAEYTTRFDEGVSQMRDDGINVDALEPILGWFYLQMVGLTSERRERAIAALTEDGFVLKDVRRVCGRLFADIHRGEGPRAMTSGSRRDGAPADSSQSMGGRGSGAGRLVGLIAKGRGKRDVHVTDREPDPEADDKYEAPEDEEEWAYDGEVDVQAVVQEELDHLADQIEEYGMEMSEDEAARLDAAAQTLGNVAEALATVREVSARAGASSSGRPAVSIKGKGRGSGGKSKGKAKGGLSHRKANSTCKACGGKGHWAGDDECPQKEKGAVDTKMTDHLDGSADSGVRDVYVVQVAAASSLVSGDPDAGRGIVDTAAGCSVAGGPWTKAFLKELEAAGLTAKVVRQPSQERFRFGDGKVVSTDYHVTAPVVIAHTPMTISWHVVENLRLPLLLGRDFVLEKAVLVDCRRRRLVIGDRFEDMKPSAKGHFSVAISPERHMRLSQAMKLRGTRGGMPWPRGLGARALAAVVYALSLLRGNKMRSERAVDVSTSSPPSAAACACHARGDAQECSGCGSHGCVSCYIGGKCPFCLADAQYPRATIETFRRPDMMAQVNAVRAVKKGTQMQLQAGRRFIEGLSGMQVTAQRVRHALAGVTMAEDYRGIHAAAAGPPLVVIWLMGGADVEASVAAARRHFGAEVALFDSRDRWHSTATEEGFRQAKLLLRRTDATGRRRILILAGHDTQHVQRRCRQHYSNLLVKDACKIGVHVVAVSMFPSVMKDSLPYTASISGCMLVDKSMGRARRQYLVRCSDHGTASLLDLRCDGTHAHVNRPFDKSADLRHIVDRVIATIQRTVHQTIPADVAGEEEQEAEPQDDEGRRKSTVLRSAIAKLHVQTGHSPPEYLARAIRLAGGTDQAVREATKYQCSVCARLKSPGPPLPHNLRGGVKNFGDLVAMDTFTLADCRGNIKLFLNVIDVASRFGLTLELASHKPEVVWDTFMAGWTNWAGFPISLLVDGGGEFEGGFREAAELVPIEVRTTAGETPQQNGICERRGGVWKSVARAVIDQFSVSFLDPSRTTWMITTANWALNSRIGVGGFSPSQWVLGRGLRLPYDLMSNHKKLALQLRARDDPDFSDRLQMVAAANRAATAAHYHRGLAKAFLARSRIKESLPAQHKFECGDQAFYFRGGSTSKREWASRWHGPALVLGFEGNNLWLSHRNCVVKCSVRHVRLAEPEEELPWKEVLDQAFRDVGETEEPVVPAESGEEEQEPIMDPLPPAGAFDEPSEQRDTGGGGEFPTSAPGQAPTISPTPGDRSSRYGRYLDLSGEPSMKSRRLNPPPPPEPVRPTVPPVPKGNTVADSDAESSSAERNIVPAIVPAALSPPDDVLMPDAPPPVVRYSGD